jgi:Ca-activated chloride channel homolog
MKRTSVARGFSPARQPVGTLVRVVTASLVVAAAHHVGAQDSTQVSRFTSTTELVSLNVSVTDQSSRCFNRFPPYWSAGWDGCPVTDLAEGTFEVLEDGVKQRIEVFHRSNVPIAVSLLIDTRSSVDARTRDVQDAAMGLVRKLRAADLAEVVGFEKEKEVHAQLTSDRATLERAIRRTSSRGQRPNQNPLQLLQKRLEPVPTASTRHIRRHAIVFLTDGEDTSRFGGVEKTLQLARRSDAAIYTIAVMPQQPLDALQEFISSLRQVATSTGGRAFFPDDWRSLAALYSQIYDEISQQYTIGYVSNNARRDGAWRSLTVRVVRPETSARTRQGYFAPSEP